MLIAVVSVVFLIGIYLVVAITEFLHRGRIMDLKSFGIVAVLIIVGIMIGVILTLIVLAFLSEQIFSG